MAPLASPVPAARTVAELDALDRRLLDEFQRDFPLSARPFAELGERLGATEVEVLARLRRLQTEGFISRIGAVFRPKRAGASTLAAMAVPAHALRRVADQVSALAEVNHNYEREHRLNLWFVVTAQDRERIDHVLAHIEFITGLEVLDLPLERSFHIDLGFPLWR